MKWAITSGLAASQPGVQIGQLVELRIGPAHQRVGIEHVDVARLVMAPLDGTQGYELTGNGGRIRLGKRPCPLTRIHPPAVVVITNK